MSSTNIKSLGRQLRQIEDPKTRSLLERMLENQDHIKSSLEAVESPALPGWRDAVLENSWVRFSTAYNPPQFTITSDKVVMVRGRISGGTTTPGTVLFNLPEGYRPEFICSFPGETSPSAHATVDIHPSGDVTIEAGGSTYFALDQIHFVAYR